MADAMSPVPEDHPLMVAWKKYLQTECFENTRKWAECVQILEGEISHPQLLGSLWAVFMQGFQAGMVSAEEKQNV